MDAVTGGDADKTDDPAGVELPEGFDDVAAFVKDTNDLFQQGVDADRENLDAAMDDLKFMTGEGMWDEKIAAKRRRLGRPVLVINDLPQFVGQVVSDMRTNRPSIKVRPVENADEDLASVRTGLIRSIENLSNATQVYALAGEDAVTCGIGHFRVALEYTADDAFDQDIRIRHIPNPLAVIWDPQSVDPTGADARWCFVIDDMDRKTFEKAYPDATTAETNVPGSEWCSRDNVRVIEHWTVQYESRTIAAVAGDNGQPVIVDITDGEDEFAGRIINGPDGRPKVREVLRRVVWMYLMTGAEVLEGPFKYRISRVPIFKVTGRETRVGTRRYRYGLVRYAKDPVRMKNIWRSAAAEFLAMAPKQQWLVSSSNPDDADRVRKAHRSGDTVLSYTGSQPPTRVDPPAAPTALLQEAQLAQQDMKDVTGLQDASLGIRSNETSGKAIIARERQGDVATFMYHDNLNLAVKECGGVVNEFIPAVYDTVRSVRVLGEDDTSKVMRINDPKNPESVDITRGKYDIYIDTGPSYATKRLETAESMAAAIKDLPIIGQVAADLFVQAQDWTMADQIAKRVKKAMPPGITADEDEQPSPEQQAAMAQQQQAQQAQMQADQMAQQMALKRGELELAEQDAKTRQAVAQADKAEAEAERAKAETQRVLAGLITFGPGVSPPPEFPLTGEGPPAAF